MDNKEELAAQKQKLESFKLCLVEENKKFEELKTSFAQIKEKLSAKASDDGDEDDKNEKMNKMMDSMYAMINYVHSRVDNCNKMIGECMEDQYKHKSNSHLPPLTASAMKKLLKTCGMEEDYDVAKKTLYTYASVKDSLEVEMLDNSKP